MASCELCGKISDPVNFLTAVIEQVEMEVCPSCASHGQVKRKSFLPPAQQPRNFPPLELPEETIIRNFSLRLREERERRKLSQEDFSRLLKEKESSLAKWESGSVLPELSVAKKIEKILGLTLVEMEKKEALSQAQRKSDALTLGDMIKVRKRK